MSIKLIHIIIIIHEPNLIGYLSKEILNFSKKNQHTIYYFKNKKKVEFLRRK